MPTRTGPFAIGFRQGSSPWQQGNGPLIRWARESGFEALDLRKPSQADVAELRSAGMRLGTVDLLEMGKLIEGDAAERTELAARNVAHIREAAALGAGVFFTVVIGNKTRSRRENYDAAVESFGPLAEAAEQVNAKIVIEGWPGPAPTFPALCCTPETCRRLIADVNPRVLGINYDPSHLIRLGVDPLRFLREFLPHVYHVHAKDTQPLPEAAYEYGIYQPAVFAEPHVYGEQAWRYTIPGHGATPWDEVFAVLERAGYGGVVSVELEDENFHGSEEKEKAGLMQSLAFLRGV